MRIGRQRGARVFDFGRSKRGTGAYEFKRLWGCTPEPMRYRVSAPGGGAVPDRTTTTLASPGTDVWQRLRFRSPASARRSPTGRINDQRPARF
jgi:hypothetical protein